MNVNIPDSRFEGYESMPEIEREYRRTINLVCDILEEYEKRKKQEGK